MNGISSEEKVISPFLKDCFSFFLFSTIVVHLFLFEKQNFFLYCFSFFFLVFLSFLPFLFFFFDSFYLSVAFLLFFYFFLFSFYFSFSVFFSLNSPVGNPKREFHDFKLFNPIPTKRKQKYKKKEKREKRRSREKNPKVEKNE